TPAPGVAARDPAVGRDKPLRAGLLPSPGFRPVAGLNAVAPPRAVHRAVAARPGGEGAEPGRGAALEGERSGPRRRTAGIYGGEALYTRPEARRLGEGSADETKEREAAVLLDPAARADSEGVLAASEARG